MPEQNLQFDLKHSATVVYSAPVAKYRFVSWAGAHATDAAQVQGISELAGPAGGAGSVVTSYSFPVEAAAAIPAGSAVAPSIDGTGRAVVATGLQCGRALTAAAAAGELVTVRVQLVAGGLPPSKQAASDALVSAPGIWSESAYTKALFFGNPLTQAGSVKDFSPNGADAVYCGGTTDAEVYNTAAGYLTTLGGTSPNNKGLALAAAKLQWRLQNGESLFIQARVLKDALPAGAEHIMGNSSGGSIPGFLLAMTPAGAIQPYVKVGSLGVALVGGSSTLTASAGTPFNVTIWIDGATKILNGWFNGALQTNWTNKSITPDGSSFQTDNPAQPGVWCIGNGGDVVSPSTRTMNAFKYAAARVMVVEPGKTIQNAALLDWKFNRDPSRLITPADLSLV